MLIYTEKKSQQFAYIKPLKTGVMIEQLNGRSVPEYAAYIYCKKCKKFEKVYTIAEAENHKIKLFKTYGRANGETRQLLFTGPEEDRSTTSVATYHDKMLEVKNYVCSKCYTRYPSQAIELYSYYGKLNENYLTFVHLEPNKKSGHLSLRIAFTRKQITGHNNSIQYGKKIFHERFCFDLITGNLYHFELAPTTSRNKFTPHVVNFEPQIMDQYTIETKGVMNIARHIIQFYKEHYDCEIPMKFILNGVDLSQPFHPLSVIARMVQFPLFTDKFYKTYVKLHVPMLERKSPQFSSFTKNGCTEYRLTSFRKERTVTMNQVCKKIGVPLKRFNKLNNPNIFNYLKCLDLAQDNIYKLDQLGVLNLNDIKTLISCFQDPVTFSPYPIYTLYFKLKGYSMQKIETLIVNKFTQKSDIEEFAHIAIMFRTLYDALKEAEAEDDTINPDERKYQKENINQFIGDFDEKNKDHVTLLDEFLKPYATDNIQEIHRRLVRNINKLKIKHVEYEYSIEEILRFEKEAEFEVQGENENDITYYSIGLAPSSTSLFECAEEMHICVAAYWRMVLQKETTILFIKKYKEGEVSYEGCIEYSQRWKQITQIKGRENHSIDPRIKPQVKEWIKANMLDLGTSDLDMTIYLSSVEGSNPYENYIMNRL